MFFAWLDNFLKLFHVINFSPSDLRRLIVDEGSEEAVGEVSTRCNHLIKTQMSVALLNCHHRLERDLLFKSLKTANLWSCNTFFFLFLLLLFVFCFFFSFNILSQTFGGEEKEEESRNPCTRHFGCLRKSSPFLLYRRAGGTEWEWPCLVVRNQFRNQFGGKIKKKALKNISRRGGGMDFSFSLFCVCACVCVCVCVHCLFLLYFLIWKLNRVASKYIYISWWLTQDGVSQQLIILWLCI